MFKLKPKEDKFYLMFLDAAQNVNEAAVILRKSLDSLEDKEANITMIEDLKHKGDKLVNVVVKELNEAFITPIDREDIYALIKTMDDVLDLINSTMHRFLMFNISESTKESRILADMVVDCTNHISELMHELNSVGNKSKFIKDKIKEVNNIENEADKLFRKTVAELFKTETNVLEVIKWKEIYQIFENTINKCEKIANTVEGVVIKNA